MLKQLIHTRYLSSLNLTLIAAVVSIFAMHWFAKTSPGVEPPKPDTTRVATKSKKIDEDALRIFQSLWLEREKIRQAVCVITEYVVNEKNEKQEFQKSRFILDAEIPALKSESINLVDPSKSFAWIETPENAVIFRPESNSMQVRLPEDAKRKIRPYEFVDPRNLGFSTRHELRSRAYHDLKAAYETLLDGGFTFAVQQDAGNRGRDVLEITSEKFKFQRRIVANPDRKFATELAEIYYLNGDPPPTGPASSITTQWDLISGINVPIECKIVKHSGQVTYILKVDWKFINKPIPKSEFSWRELKINDSTRIGIAK